MSYQHPLYLQHPPSASALVLGPWIHSSLGLEAMEGGDHPSLLCSLSLQARCIYNASELLPLRMEVAIPTTAAPVARPGPLGLQLRIATGEDPIRRSPSCRVPPYPAQLLPIPVDESYSSYHPDGDFPLVKVLRDPIYVEVRLLQKTDPNLVLVLHHCWASPSTEPTAEPQWPILVDG